jgi:hypothetical protein
MLLILHPIKIIFIEVFLFMILFSTHQCIVGDLLIASEPLQLLIPGYDLDIVSNRQFTI